MRDVSELVRLARKLVEYSGNLSACARAIDDPFAKGVAVAASAALAAQAEAITTGLRSIGAIE